MRILFSFLTFFLFFNASASELSDRYIQKYKDVAISEMHRTGIPASIKLAQGLLESDWGRSNLATEANNHFGIKCGSAWIGGTFYKEDDDRNHKGEMIESCFRAFSDPYESYIAHSDFLTDTRKQERYGMLFLLSPGDYKSWAKGLKKSGYATDPNYPKKLIKIIEQYDLHQYDLADEILAEAPKREKVINESEDQGNEQDYDDVKDETTSEASKTSGKSVKRSTSPSKVIGAIYEINKCRVVNVSGGESIKEIAQRYRVEVNDILLANEVYSTENDIIGKGEVIFLDKKKRSYRGDEEYHKVLEGETMQSISQLYGIRLSSLYAKNRMPKKSEIVVGEKLYLKKTVHRGSRPKFTNENSTRAHKYLFVEED